MSHEPEASEVQKNDKIQNHKIYKDEISKYLGSESQKGAETANDGYYPAYDEDKSWMQSEKFSP